MNPAETRVKPISTLTLIAALLAFALAALSFDATAQRKLYRWTDKDGNVHTPTSCRPKQRRTSARN